MGAATPRPGWILSCQQLVELYYGVRMIAQIKESLFNIAPGVMTQILTSDPRRIRYEINVSFDDVTSDTAVAIGTPQSFDTGTVQAYQLATGSALAPFAGMFRVERSFLNDLDAVTLPLNCQTASSPCTVTVRETFLTPVPNG